LLQWWHSLGYAALAQQPTSVQLRKPAGGETFRAGTSQDLEWWWDTTGASTVYPVWRFQFGTSPTGPWQDLPGARAVKDSGRTRLRFPGGFRVPAVRTTTGYVRIVLVNPDGSLNEAVSDVNDAPFTIVQPEPIRVDSVLRDPIRTVVTLSRNKIYGLDGYVFVDSGGVLRIEPGTIIVGDTVGQNSSLCVNRGGIIYANGRPDAPIVFTSSAPPGQRAAGDGAEFRSAGARASTIPADRRHLRAVSPTPSAFAGGLAATMTTIAPAYCATCGLSSPESLPSPIRSSTG
jgi:hypothetical protein